MTLRVPDSREQRIGPASSVDGVVTVAGDKSISHRALIVGALCPGRSYIGNLSPAADVAATMRCLAECGVWLRPYGGGRVSVEGSGPGRSLSAPLEALGCANSATTMRLLAGVLAGHALEATLDGDDSLRRRPMRRVAEPLTAMGAEVTTSGGVPPVRVKGRTDLRGITWAPEVASAQVKSAILLAGLGAGGATTVVEPVATRDHTERLLRHCGIAVSREAGRVTMQPGTPSPFGLQVPGDISSAAFFLALAAARPGWHVGCDGVGLNPARTGVLDVLRTMGADVEVSDDAQDGTEPRGRIDVSGARLSCTTIRGELTMRCLDEVPVLAVLATQAEGTTEIRDAGELRVKESDRVAQLAAGLRAMGAECDTFEDGLAVRGPVKLRGTHVDSAGDHRLAMAFAVAGALAEVGDTTVLNAEVVSVSAPSFFEQLAALCQA